MKSGEAERAKPALLWYDSGMIRTRDFLLFLIAVAFLVVGISVETAKRWFVDEEVNVEMIIVPDFADTDTKQKEIGAEIVSRANIDREGNLARLRKQLSSFIANAPKKEEIIAMPVEEELPAPDTTTPGTVGTSGTVMLCGGYKSYSGAWPNQLLNIEEQEGVRVISKPANGVSVLEAEVVAVLPIRNIGNSFSPTCLSSDVVAVAQSGSLIRNSEYAGYLAFPEHMLIGYTLDGFPLYGYSEREVDRCGGALVDETYRYYLSQSRESVLDCFVALPISLP